MEHDFVWNGLDVLNKTEVGRSVLARKPNQSKKRDSLLRDQK